MNLGVVVRGLTDRRLALKEDVALYYWAQLANPIRDIITVGKMSYKTLGSTLAQKSVPSVK